jgi:hypothetical protein
MQSEDTSEGDEAYEYQGNQNKNLQDQFIVCSTGEFNVCQKDDAEQYRQVNEDIEGQCKKQGCQSSKSEIEKGLE